MEGTPLPPLEEECPNILKLHYSTSEQPCIYSPSLLMHILSSSCTNSNIVKSVLNVAWKSNGVINFKSMDPNTFFVTFSSDVDKSKVIERGL